MMKKISVLTFFLFAIFITGNAQLRYGFRFGGEFASARLKNVPAYALDNRSGFSGGLMLEYQFEKNGFAPDIAVLYTRYNTRLMADGTDPICFGRNFIEIPLHLKYKFWLKSTHDLFAPLIYTGPSLSFRLDHNDAFPLTTKRVQPAWDLGIGFDIINFIQVTAGYRFGLGNAVKMFYDNPDASMKADGWNLSVNMIFDF